MPEPYLIRSTGPGEADVVDRATGAKLGWVRADFWGRWEAYVSRPYGVVGGFYRYRADAARVLWEMRRGERVDA